MQTGKLIKRDLTQRPLGKIPGNHEVLKYCYLCGGKLVNPTREHIIAKSIFSPNSLDKPLILKACYSHNQEKKRDDEYSSLLVQASSDTPASKDAFEKSLNIVKKKFDEVGPVDNKTPGIGLVMGLKKNVRDLPFIKHNGILRPFGGGEFDVDVPRFNNFFTNIGKGLLVYSTQKIYDWNNFKFNILFDHTVYAQIQDRLKPAFDYIVQNSQFAEKWEDELFVAGVNAYSPENKVGSLFAVTLFTSHVAVISMREH